MRDLFFDNVIWVEDGEDGERIVWDEDIGEEDIGEEDIGFVGFCWVYGVLDHDINGPLDIFGSCQQLEDILGKLRMTLDICDWIWRNMVCIV